MKSNVMVGHQLASIWQTHFAKICSKYITEYDDISSWTMFPNIWFFLTFCGFHPFFCCGRFVLVLELSGTYRRLGRGLAQLGAPKWTISPPLPPPSPQLEQFLNSFEMSFPVNVPRNKIASNNPSVAFHLPIIHKFLCSPNYFLAPYFSYLVGRWWFFWIWPKAKGW